MDKKIERLLSGWHKRNILGYYCANKKDAVAKIMEIIPPDTSIGTSGSVTIDELGLIKLLELRGNKVFNQYAAGISRQESFNIRRQGTQADFYLASANAVSEKGEMVFFSAYGNRTAGISYGKNVLIICGINKLVKNIGQALKRARNHATPRNCKRLDWQAACFERGACREKICLFPEYKRMCCQVLIIEAEMIPDRLRVVLINEKIGF